MAVLLTLHAEVAAHGVWCPICASPSATTFKVYTMCELGVFPPTTRTRCHKCKRAT